MPEKSIDLTKGLRAWTEKNDIKPAQFAQKTGYGAAYAWDILRGKGTFTQEGLGRFVFAYGIEAMADVLRLAGDDRIVKVNDSQGETEGVIIVKVKRTPLSVAE